MIPWLTLLIVAACAPLAWLAGAVRPGGSGVAGVIMAAGATAALLAQALAGPAVLIDVAWLPDAHARFTLGLDGLAAMYAVLAAGIGTLVVLYSTAYIPRHLAHEARPRRDERGFHAQMLAFLGAMVLLVTARDLLVMFVALDLTALASYFLIRFDHRKPEARRAALLALLLTAGTSLLFLVGTLLVARQTATLQIDALPGRLAAGPATTIGAACIAAGVLAKSAQFPLHFWLPRAMIAPTPVSAYLHSAAMVAAGVFVLQRLDFLIRLAPPVQTALFAIAIASILTGSLIALLADPLKRILAGSTIAQYGYVLLLIAMDSDAAAVAGPLYVAVHALCKSALFMTAGTITLLTGRSTLSESGGLVRRFPVLALASGIAAAGLAGLPATAGYFKDELFFAAAWQHGPATGVLAALAAALTLAYTARFWFGLFTGKPSPEPAGRALAAAGAAPAPAEKPAGRANTDDPGPAGHREAGENASGRARIASPRSRGLVLPVAILAGLVLVGGFPTAPLASIARAAGQAIRGGPVTADLAYHLAARPETLLALGAWTLGALLFLGRRVLTPPLRALTEAVAWTFGPDRWADRVGAAVAFASNRLHSTEIRDLRDRAGGILLPIAVLAIIGLLDEPARTILRIGAFPQISVPVLVALLTTAIAAVLVGKSTGHLEMILLLSFSGFGLALVFAFTAAPDVALVSVLIETTLTLLFLALLVQVAPALLARARRELQRSRRRDLILALVSGIVAMTVSWSALSRTLAPSIAREYVERAGSAHAGDIVTAILADFRGLDTAVEISVLAITILGVAAMRWERR